MADENEGNPLGGSGGVGRTLLVALKQILCNVTTLYGSESCVKTPFEVSFVDDNA